MGPSNAGKISTWSILEWSTHTVGKGKRYLQEQEVGVFREPIVSVKSSLGMACEAFAVLFPAACPAYFTFFPSAWDMTIPPKCRAL